MFFFTGYVCRLWQTFVWPSVLRPETAPSFEYHWLSIAPVWTDESWARVGRHGSFLHHLGVFAHVHSQSGQGCWPHIFVRGPVVNLWSMTFCYWVQRTCATFPVSKRSLSQHWLQWSQGHLLKFSTVGSTVSAACSVLFASVGFIQIHVQVNSKIQCRATRWKMCTSVENTV